MSEKSAFQKNNYLNKISTTMNYFIYFIIYFKEWDFLSSFFKCKYFIADKF